MTLIVNSISYANDFNAGTTDWLLGVIGEKRVVTITVTAEWQAIADSDNVMHFDSSGFIYWPGNNFNQCEFKPGDSVTVTGTTNNNTTFTVSGFDSSFEKMYVVESVTAEAGSDTALLTGVTPLEGLTFKYNLIENGASESYLSLTDGNELRFTHNDLDYTDTNWRTCTQQGVYKSNHLGSCRIKGTGTLNKFVIEHAFYVTPFGSPDDISDLENSIAPVYLKDYASLKYIYNVSLMRDLSNPNIYHSNDSSVFMLGNVGWFNENHNGNIPEFTSGGIEYSIGGAAADEPDFNQETDFAFTINSATGKFSNNNTKFLVNHWIIPEIAADYINTSTDQTTNFMFDRVWHTGTFATYVNGDQFGTSEQVLKEVYIEYVSASQVIVHGKLSLSTAYKTRLASATNPYFCLSVVTQDHTLASDIADTVAVWPGLQSYTTDLSNPGLLNSNTNFYFHPSTSIPVGYGGVFKEDAVLASSIFSVDISNSPVIQKATVRIYATDGNDSFDLETKEFSFAGAVTQSGVQQINVEGSRGFRLAEDDPFNQETIIRRSDLDSGNLRAYQIKYAFKLRWEDYIQLPNVDPTFYDTTKAFNGFNNDWSVFAASWHIKFDVEVVIEENGYVNTFTDSKLVTVYDYEAATDWSSAVWTVTDANSNVLGAFLPETGIVTVQAIFTKLSGSNPAIGDVAGLIEVEPYENGGIQIIRQTSTVREYDDSGTFISMTGLNDNLLLKENPTASTYRFTTQLDCSKLPVGERRLSARIYVLTGPPLEGDKQFQNGDSFSYQDGQPYSFQYT